MRELPMEHSRFATMPPTDQEQFELPSIGLVDLWRLVARRKWLIAGSVALCLGLAVLYLVLATPVYESEVEILVTQKDAQFAATSYDVPEAARKSDELLATHVQIFQSRRIIQEAIKKQGLDQIPAIREKVKLGVTVPDMIRKNLEVRRGGEGSARDAHVVSAAFRSTSPELSAVVLDALVESYQNFLGETFEDVSSEAVVLIEQAKDDLLTQLKQQEEELRAFREASPLLWQNEQTSNMHAQRLDQIELELAQVRSRRAQVTSRLKIIEEALGDGKDGDLSATDKLALLSNEDVARLSLLVQATQGQHYASEQFLSQQPLREQVAQAQSNRLLALMQEEQRLLERHGSEHLNVREIRKQIEAGERYLQELLAPVEGPNAEEEISLAALVETQIEILRHDAKDLEGQETILTGLAGYERNEAKRVAADELTAELIQAEMQRTKELYTAVVERLREISLVRDYGGYVTEVIAGIEIPEEPVAPMPAFVLLVGCVAGTMLGGALAMTAELTDRTFHSPTEVRQALGVPIMGQVPLLTLPRKGLLSRGGDEQDGGIDRSVVVHWDPRGRGAETIRGLRTALHFGSLAQGQRVIQVTSPNPGDGKTTLAANLAVAVASSGKRVLLIDADLRRPRAGRILGVTGEEGLVDVLSGEAGLTGVIQEAGVPGLWVLPSGRPPANPAELLSRPELDELVAAVREDYDLVLIDTPPLLAVSDPAVTAPRVEGVLLVVRITRNGRPDVLRAKETLDALGANVLGVVLNEKDQDRSFGYGYGGGYGSSYGSNREYTAYLDEDGETAASNGTHHANGNGRPNATRRKSPEETAQT